MKNYFEEFYKRYEDLKGVVGDLSSDENLRKALNIYNEELKSDTKKIEGELSSEENKKKAKENQKNNQLLINLIMAGLGMGTLYLRMGAIIMIAEELAKPDNEKNISFLKVIADNLVSKPPNDGEWTNIWVKYLELNTNSIWNNLINEANDQNQNIPKIKFNIRDFVEFRNNIAHQKISLGVDYLKQIKEGFNTLRVMAKFKDIFINCSFEENTQLVFFSKKLGKPINVWPYIRVDEENKKEAIGKQPYQPNVEGIVPYLFSGKYYQGAKFINTQGGETNKEKDEYVEDNFKEIQKVIANFNGDKAFPFDEKINNYNKWCIGRENEEKAIMEWINKETDKNVLPIFAPAGLGKGALVAKVKDSLDKKNIKHLLHFCGSGAANNLQAILYSLIIQGGWDKDINEIIKKPDKSIWNIKNLSPKLQNRFARFPTQYVDVIELFQGLLISIEPKSEKIEIDIAQHEKVLNEIDDANKLNGIFSNVKKSLLAINEDTSENHRIELLTYLTNLIEMMKVRKVWQEKYYKDLYEIHCSFKKYDFDNNLISLIPDEFQVNSDNYKNPKLKEKNKLVIIIDGLDEAAVADYSKRITDWFYTYDDKGDRKEKWKSPDYIKWIFTYRQTSKENKEGFQFEYHEFNSLDIPDMQPLKGLTKEAVKKGLQEEFKTFEPELTAEFIDTIIQKGAVK